MPTKMSRKAPMKMSTKAPTKMSTKEKESQKTTSWKRSRSVLQMRGTRGTRP
jgi:hypothetical protein